MIEQKILHVLEKHSEPVSSQKLSQELFLSDKTVTKYLNLLKDELQMSGAEIIIRQGYGSLLKVNDPVRFQKFKEHFNSESFLADPSDRQKYILYRLLSNNGYTNLYEFADELNISSSLLRKDLKEIVPILEKYSLSLVNSHFRGYQITGSEESKRQCLKNECYMDRNVGESLLTNGISEDEKTLVRRLIEKALDHYHIAVPGQSIDSLTLHVLIAINRYETNNPIELEDSFQVMQLKSKPEFYVAKALSKELNQYLHIQLPENELIYLTLHIRGQQRFFGNEHLQVTVNMPAMVFYNQFLRNIWQMNGEDFFKDADLRTSLLNHIVPFLNRVSNNMQIEKTELSNISSEFPYSYDLAVSGLSMFREDHITITDAEISYFAIHLELSLEKRKSAQNLKYNMLVFCDASTSVYHMLSYKLKQAFENEVNEIVFRVPSDSKPVDLNNFQIILNTSSSSDHVPDNAIPVSPLLNQTDIEKIKSQIKSISSGIMDNILLKETLFMDLSAKNQKQVLNAMIDQVRKSIDLPADFLDRVEARESFASTEYDNKVAIPHPLDNSDLPEFVCVARLSKAITWHKKPVQLVFLVCNRGMEASLFYQKIAGVIADPKHIHALLSAKDFNEFVSYFERI